MYCTVVRAAPHAIWLRDGTAMHLHRVNTPSARAVSLRALRRPGGWQVVDITRIALELRDELPGAHERDVDGLVLFALRAACPTADEFLVAAARATDVALTRLANASHIKPETQEV
jgi:hypothetical protein